jgi:hypothetical protein
MTMLCLLSLTEQKKSMPYTPTQQFSQSDAFTVTKLKQFSRKIAPEPDCCF